MPVKAKFWVTVKATRGQVSNKVNMVRGVKLSQNKPDMTTADSEAIEIELEFPDGYFDENRPKVEITVRDTLVPEVKQFEQTIASLPNAAKGAQQVANEDTGLVPTKRIPITQRKLSEYLLRELMKLDGVPVDTDQVRTARKSTVKEIQSYLDRIDAAWKSAIETKGVVNDI